MLGLTLAPRRLAVAVIPQVFRSFSVSSSALKGKKVYEDAGLTPPPKAAPTAYILFVSEYFASNKSSLAGPDGKIRLVDAQSAVTTAWTNLSESKKSKYAETANASKADAEAAYATWYDSLSKADISQIQKITGAPVRAPGGKLAHRAKLLEREKGMGAPTRPLTGFFLFQKELRSKGGQSGEEAGITGFAKKSGGLWKGMSEEEKKPYVDESAKQRAAYKSWQEQNGKA